MLVKTSSLVITKVSKKGKPTKGDLITNTYIIKFCHIPTYRKKINKHDQVVNVKSYKKCICRIYSYIDKEKALLVEASSVCDDLDNYCKCTARYLAMKHAIEKLRESGKSTNAPSTLFGDDFFKECLKQLKIQCPQGWEHMENVVTNEYLVNPKKPTKDTTKK